MKRIKYMLPVFLLMLLTISSCKKEILDLKNPNEPGLVSLETEEGMKRAALGVYSKFGLDYWWLTLGYHDIMGDTYFISAGNFSWRWANQTAKITLSNGTVLTPPQGGLQGVELKARNDRSFGDDNAFSNEWESCYAVNNQANLLLEAVKSPALKITNDAEMKKKVLSAWAYWWKGFAYSRLGSMYISGLITDESGKTNGNFVLNTAIIAEANKNFDLAIAQLQGLPYNLSYGAFLQKMIPDFVDEFGTKETGSKLSPEAWIRNINTYKARNLLVNKSVDEMTSADWTTIKTLATNGIQANDAIFTNRSAAANDLVSQNAWAPARLIIAGWMFVSERLVQDFKTGDDRRARNVITYPSGTVVNRSGRGFQYGTRWAFRSIETGGDYASNTAGLAVIPIACSYEENELMLAEANIKLGQVDLGLGSVDKVRAFQRAALPAVANTGLNPTQAYEELRRERRIGLINKNVSFYDARRWGVIKAGGGRTGAVIVGPNGVIDNNAKIEYNYLNYWDVPKNELDFNTPSNPSVPVAAN
ncbi:RagB/SusD family nutrient uptake outer membrane protein [Pedobacter caeni]|uniref:SusD family protein n=1 Tax=Pedobacter caeni TaxID=288992 RepID=A0A1M5MQ65_9SPHI|nr:RagB/SusD family nutrient uptake outer membrane protein [Pedobacter caeni]SHG79347.1 SusD family protein [Pedobacter caeni]